MHAYAHATFTHTFYDTHIFPYDHIHVRIYLPALRLASMAGKQSCPLTAKPLATSAPITGAYVAAGKPFAPQKAICANFMECD